MEAPVTKPKRHFRLKRILLWIGTAFLCLILLAGLFTQTGLFRNWLRDFIVESINETINAELFIGDLDGNFISNFRLSDISLKYESDTVVSIGTIFAEYSIMPIFNGVIQIDSIAVESVYTSLVQENDSSWNLSNLMMVNSAQEIDETESEPFGYTIRIRDFVLSKVTANIQSLNEMIPKRLVDFGLHLSAQYKADRQKLLMHELHLTTDQPQIQIRDINFQAEADPNKISFRDLIITTIGNRIEASGDYYPDKPASNSAKIAASPVSLDEFKEFLPEVAAAFEGDITFDLSLEKDTADISISAQRSDQQINMKATTSPFNSLLDSNSSKTLQYSADINMLGVNLSEWIQNPEFDMLLNGSIIINGNGIDPDKANIRVDADLSRSKVLGHALRKLKLNSSLDNGNVSLTLSTGGAFGGAQIVGNIKNILEQPEYDFNIDLEHVDLSRLGFIDTLDTDLNLHLEVAGEGTSYDSLSGNLNLTIAPSKVMWLEISHGNTIADFSGTELILDTMSLATSFATIGVSGEISQTSESVLDYDINLFDTSVVAGILGEDAIGLYGQITGSVTGVFPNLQIDAEYGFDDLLYNDYLLESVRGDINADYIDSTISGGGKIFVAGLHLNDVLLDSIDVKANYKNNKASMGGSVWHQLFQTSYQAEIELDTLLNISLEEFEIECGKKRWISDNNPTEIIIDSNKYSINNFRLLSAEDRQQAININGIVDLDKNEVLTVKVTNLELKPLAKLIDQEISGLFSSEITINSPILKPDVTARFDLQNGKVQDYNIYGLNGELSFVDEIADFLINLKTSATDSLAINGTVPIILDSTNTDLMNNQAIDINIVVDSLPLNILKAGGDIVDEAGGFLNGNINITQSLTDPAINGKLSITNGRIVSSKYGLKFENIQSGFSFLPHRIVLDSIALKRNKGSFRVSGFLDYDSSLIAGEIKTSHFDIGMKKFFLVRHRDYEIQLTSDIKIDGKDSLAAYAGSILVNRSRFYLPALMAQYGDESPTEISLPLLVSATADTGVVAKSDSLRAGALPKNAASIDWMSRLSGRMKLTIPKNTWIKSPDLSMELAGDLEIVQDRSEPEIVGNIRVVRGHYDLYGRRIKVRRGEIIFNGGSYMDPTLDIEALYVFRTASKEKKELRLYITGTGKQPIISFTLDGIEITEGDALSYIIFGRGLDELNQNQHSSLSKELGAGKIAEGMASKMLSGAIGSKLNMDVMEIKAGGDLESAAIIIGKYITPDLFMSYQRSFGSSTDDDLEPEIVTLEYQLTRLIYLQLTEGDAEEAGFDIIIKLQKD